MGGGQLKRGSTGVSEVEGRGRGAAKKGFNLDGDGGGGRGLQRGKTTTYFFVPLCIHRNGGKM